MPVVLSSETLVVSPGQYPGRNMALLDRQQVKVASCSLLLKHRQHRVTRPQNYYTIELLDHRITIPQNYSTLKLYHWLRTNQSNISFMLDGRHILGFVSKRYISSITDYSLLQRKQLPRQPCRLRFVNNVLHRGSIQFTSICNDRSMMHTSKTKVNLLELSSQKCTNPMLQDIDCFFIIERE